MLQPKVYLILSLSLLTAGCSLAPQKSVPLTRRGLMSDYLLQVQKSDGINREEAVLIAQSELLFKGDEKRFYIKKPQVDAAGNRYWAVHFFPINKTLSETSQHEEMVILVDKTSGVARIEK